MTCQSCSHTRPDGCAEHRPLWPDVGVACDGFQYEPGSDEAEDASVEADTFAEDWL